MGTRHLILVKLGNKTKVAQYGQWDGYPSGQGVHIAKFLKKLSKKENLQKFKENLKKVKFISDKEVSQKWVEAGSNNNEWVGMEVSNTFERMYPELHRNTGARVLDFIYKGVVEELYNNSSFLKDKVFCEYAYEINVSKKTVKVYVGDTKPYKTYSFSKFTSQAMQQLEKELSEDY